MNRSITSKIVQVDETFVTIEPVDIRPGFEPFRTSVDIEHHGDPEKVHRGFHDSITGDTPEEAEARRWRDRTKLAMMAVGEM
jgi:hypothetical protein